MVSKTFYRKLLGGRQSEEYSQKKCSYCAGELLLDHESGESVCTSCGVVSNHPDHIASLIEPNAFIPGLNRDTSLAEQVGASTIIGYGDMDAKGRHISQGRDLKQLRRLDTMVTWDSKKRRLRNVSMQIRRISQSLGMSDIIAERGFEVYRREFGTKSPRAKSLAAVAAASICVACRELGVARPTNDVVAMHAEVNKKQLRRYYTLMVSAEASREVFSPVNYISSIAGKVGLKGTTERIALDMLSKLKGEPGLMGKRPVSIAAATLYLASVKGDDRTTQLRLAYASGVTPITIRKRSTEISRILEQK
jgi:transcription initiation factor TFIIB